MTEKTKQAFGTWPSPISAELITKAAPSLNFMQSHGDSLYWVEGRPWDTGRSVIMCRDGAGIIRDLLRSPFSHYSKVHEYGGMAYAVSSDSVYFVNAADQRIYRMGLSGEQTPTALTEDGLRFADLAIDATHQRLIAIGEQHHEDREPENFIAAISLATGDVSKLASGADFYAYPSISPDQQQLSWIEWHHPNMPWDCTQLWRAHLTNSGLAEPTLVAGGNNDQAIFQPRWSPDNRLYYVSDQHNWWNIYQANGDIVLSKATEFATPLWQFGMATYDFIDANTIGCLWTEKGFWYKGFIDITSGTLTQAHSQYSSMHAACCHQGRLYMVAGAAALANQIVGLDPSGKVTSVYAPSTLDLNEGDIAQPESLFFPSGNQENGEQVHAFFYPPTNANYQGLDNELPLVIALCHGGPTGATDSGLNLKIQYWTNRGFAVIDINYRGSTGFGRKYRQALAGTWGIADVEDTKHAVGYLAKHQKIDPERCLIRGGSAGGYTVLSALTFTDTFKAGASLYGIGDLETLATDTHKFESRYLDSLIGPYPERRDIYRERSPIHHAEGLNCPVIFLQGLEDKVVPPNQAEMMVELLTEKGIKVDYVTFPDEGHGFRKANNIIRAMESELSFYQDVFNLAGKA
ncbi:MAG: prolyl oligopeptidase family serine peptidase [Porticoccaceae bacterium]|nr:prolyl oligopeptidase family serine peptidase [Porticoccaceae bacterium]MDG1311545.1 prolyl oligopeptidase family serine peptidase [Porticoccaceae bacterium]